MYCIKMKISHVLLCSGMSCHVPTYPNENFCAATIVKRLFNDHAWCHQMWSLDTGGRSIQNQHWINVSHIEEKNNTISD